MVVWKSLELKLRRIANAQRLITSSAWNHLTRSLLDQRSRNRILPRQEIRLEHQWRPQKRANDGRHSTAMGISQYVK